LLNPRQPALRALLKRRFARAQSIFEKFEPLHSAIIAYVATHPESDLEAKEQIRMEFFEAFDEIDAAYVRYFPEVERPASSPNSINSSSSTCSNLRLPKLSLRTFDGNFSEWTSFIQFFDNAIHSRPELARIEKFQYLISSLTGGPLNLVKAITLSEENYPIAYSALVDWYENKRKLSYHYWNTLKQLPKLTSESASGLRKLSDKFKENRSALMALNLAESLEDFMWFQLLLEKLDPDTRKLFESDIRTLGPAEIPKFKQLADFIEGQCCVLDSLGKPREPASTTNSSRQVNTTSKAKSVFIVDSSPQNCALCTGEHVIYKCPEFTPKTSRQRFEIVKSRRLCINCLGPAHNANACNSKSSCRVCKERHHTMLHFEKSSASPANPGAPSSTLPPASSTTVAGTSSSSSSSSAVDSSLTTLTSAIENKIVLLATAVIEVKDARGHFQRVRAVLDNCSQGSFIAQKCLRRLGLRFTPSKIRVRGINPGAESTSPGFVECRNQPRNKPDQSKTINVHVLPQLAGDMPAGPVDISNWKHLCNLELADPDFNTPHRVEMLLGGDLYASLLKPGVLLGSGPGEPAAINTVFGWVINGPVDIRTPSVVHACLTTVDSDSLEFTLKRFWQLEEVPEKTFANPSDAQCEELFSAAVTRSENGRYTVALPFKTSAREFPNSREIAVRRFFLLENRLIRNPTLQKDYVAFMQDYLELGHMSLAPPAMGTTARSYYIPHHCVQKPDSASTKLCVVFDASAKCANGQSLNDTLHTGPKLLQAIVRVLLNFRLHRVVFTADVRQMYRQISIAPNDREFQRIIWRSSPDDALQDYYLNTVTYGICSAPFLAIRTLLQLASDEQSRFPRAAAVVRSDIYMDDIVTGCDSVQDALELQEQLIKLLQCGQFELRKWASNALPIIEHLDSSFRQDVRDFDSGDSVASVKILGLQWLPSQDVFSFKVKPTDRTCTKRTILSEIARIFYPLGFFIALNVFRKAPDTTAMVSWFVVGRNPPYRNNPPMGAISISITGDVRNQIKTSPINRATPLVRVTWILRCLGDGLRRGRVFTRGGR
jgi:hypothetical protein